MAELTLDEREQLLDLLAERECLLLLLAKSRADGSKTLAHEAIEQVFAPVPPDVHQVVFPPRVPFVVRHPVGCVPPGCPVEACARRTLTLDRYDPGIRECWVGVDGWLCTTDVTP